MKGTVKFFNTQKGFGFITGEDEADYFFHVTELPEGSEVDQGAEVEFVASENDKGKIATKIQIQL